VVIEDRARAAIASVCDPEIPVLTLDDLGVIRRVALAEAGLANARIHTVLSPAWTTDWMSAGGRAKLAEYGIAPPAAKASRRALFGDDDALACPRCLSARTIKISEFGSTACKSLWRCESCLEPFDAFKCI
jgi:ring-1,2-phenylacetyl-CoA epoxidase subunit PaaD